MYLHERAAWPNFRWRDEALGFPFRSEARLQTLTEDVLKGHNE
jgi:hypothetical protein